MSRVIQWRNENTYRSYPLLSGVQTSYTDGVTIVSLTNDTILDLQCAAYVTMDGPLHIKHIQRVAGAPLGNTMLGVYAGTVFLANLYIPDGAVFPYNIESHSDTATVKATIGPGIQSTYDAMQDGDDLLREGTGPQLEPVSLIDQSNHRVQSIVGDTEDSIPITGDVQIEEGYSCRIDINLGSNAVRVSAVKGAGAGWSCDPVASGVVDCTGALVALNGIYGDGYGNIELDGGRGISVTPDPDNHVLVIHTGIQDLDIECNSEQ